MKNRLFTIIRIIISFSLIVLLLWLMRDKWPEIIATMRYADVGFAVAGFFTYLCATIIIAYRLIKVISVQSIKISPKEGVYLTFLGYFFNNFLPTSFGGDILKAYYLGKKSGKKGASFAGVFMDRILAMIPFTLIPAFTLAFCMHKVSNRVLIFGIYAIFAMCFVFLWLLLHKRTAKYMAFVLEPFREKFWYQKIRSGYNFLNLYSEHKIVLAWSFALSTFAQAISIIAVYLFARAVGVDYVGMGIFFIIVPIVWIMTMIPSLNGLGIREGGLVYLLGAYMPPEKAFAISILLFISLAIFSVFGGLIYTFKKEAFSVKAEGLK